MPRCHGCGSLERHRAFRVVLNAIAPVFATRPVLQFSADLAAPRHEFGSFEVSEFGTDTHLDMADIEKADGAYGLVIANHVLEHVADDLAAIGELDRITALGGAVFLSVPDLLRVEKTIEYGRARDDKHGHYRLYGPDIVERWREGAPLWHGVGMVAYDPVTGAEDRATLLSRDPILLADLTRLLQAAAVNPFNAFL